MTRRRQTLNCHGSEKNKKTTPCDARGCNLTDDGRCYTVIRQSDFNCDSKSPRLEQSLIICCFIFFLVSAAGRRRTFPVVVPPLPHLAPGMSHSFRQPDAGCCRPQRKSPGMEGSRGVERPRRDNGRPLAVGRTELNNQTSSFVPPTASSPLKSHFSAARR